MIDNLKYAELEKKTDRFRFEGKSITTCIVNYKLYHKITDEMPASNLSFSREAIENTINLFAVNYED